jgi:hypothetical protein
MEATVSRRRRYADVQMSIQGLGLAVDTYRPWAEGLHHMAYGRRRARSASAATGAATGARWHSHSHMALLLPGGPGAGGGGIAIQTNHLQNRLDVEPHSI